MIADRFPEVSVLVADLVDFTPSSDRSSPERVVGVLDDLFTADMVAGGLPSPRPDHAQAVADMALALREEVGRHRDPTGQPLAIRIGIDTGPVVAGVIGTSKFSDDLWGDTVNTASRMQATGGRLHPGHPPDLPAAAGRLPPPVPGTGPGQGKGELVTWFLLGRDDGSGPTA